MKNKYYAILGVLFLLLSLAGASYLSFQNADIRNRAAIDPGTCMCKKGDQSIKGGCNANGGCKCPEGYSTGANKCDESPNPTGGVSNLPFCSTMNLAGVDQSTWDARCESNLNETPCQIGTNNNKTGYRCKCIDMSPNSTCKFYARNCTEYVPNICVPEDGAPPANKYCFGTGCTVPELNSSCYVAYYRSDKKDDPTVLDIVVNKAVKSASLGQVKCGAEQIDVMCSATGYIACGAGSHQSGDCSVSRRYDVDCGVKPTDKPSTPTPPKTNTPTPPKVITVTPSPTGILSPTPTTPVITNTPTPTPTNPVITDTPTPTPTIGYLGCGYTPCDNNGRPCSSGLVCITANNSAQYCSQPQFTSTCATNPGYVGCCTAPVTPTTPVYTEGPSPTRIILPVSGFEFPSQALTIIGGIATLLGFLILL